MRIILVLALMATLATAACGGDDDGSSTGATSAAASPSTVSVKTVEGVGDVLVDAGGSALYAADEEADGTVRCVASCLAIWKPLAPAGSEPTARGDAGELGVLTRPDGGQQVTVNGRPLYTFTQEQPGEVTGNGLADTFGDEQFTWHAVLAGGAASGGTGDAGPAYTY